MFLLHFSYSKNRLKMMWCDKWVCEICCTEALQQFEGLFQMQSVDKIEWKSKWVSTSLTSTTWRLCVRRTNSATRILLMLYMFLQHGVSSQQETTTSKNSKCAVIGRCPWSIRGQRHAWRHWKLVFLVLLNMACGFETLSFSRLAQIKAIIK